MQRQKGTTLIELMIATLIFSIALAGLLNALLATLTLIQSSKDTTVAVADLGNVLERMRATPFSSLTTDFPDGDTDGASDTEYADIVGGYTLEEEHITISYVNAADDPLEINAQITWENKQGRQFSTEATTSRTR
jgi:prepilin-type N-terminal cleavage/methylation domain-containing protein